MGHTADGVDGVRTDDDRARRSRGARRALVASLARKWPDSTDDEAGYDAQWELFRRISSLTGSTPAVIDSDPLRLGRDATAGDHRLTLASPADRTAAVPDDQTCAVTSFLDGYLPYLLQRADQTLSARFHRYLADEGVQTSEWRVLAVLAETGPLAVGALTRLTLLPQPTTTHAVRRLEERGHVRRRTDRHDGRLRIVELTARGRRRADQLIAAADRELARTISDAGFDVSDGLVADLRRLVDALGAPT